jgi:hypothetical protein
MLEFLNKFLKINEGVIDMSGNNTTTKNDVSGNNTTTKNDVSGNNTTTKNDISGNNTTTKNDISKNNISNKTDVSENNTKKHSNTVDDLNNSIEKFIKTTFQKSNIILLIWFLAIYFIIYILLGFFISKNNESSNIQLRISNIADLIVLITVLFISIYFFFSNSETEIENTFKDFFNNTKNYIDNPNSLLITGFFIIAFYIILFLFRFPMSKETKPFFIYIIESLAWILFIIIAFIDFFKYVLGIRLIDMFNKFFTKEKKTDNTLQYSKNTQKPLQLVKTNNDEVFNISNNLYTYDDAQAICTSYGAKLATYDQLEKAYNNGAEWCNYGWSDGQMAFFPTQKSTWTELQKNPNHKNDCGRPGINGGYIHNPNVKFGVNCYGKKPKPSTLDMTRFNSKQNTVFPKSEADIALENKVNYWKQNGEKMLQLNSFNNVKWNEF